MKRIILFISILCASVTAIAQETKSQLVTRFDVIRNETAVGGNTKARIANAYQELSDGMIGVYPIEATGTNTYSGSLIGIDGYNKRIFFVTFQNNNTGASTLNINSIGAVAIQKDVSGTWTALSSGDILAGKLYQLFHDGTRFQIDLGGSGSTITASNGLTKVGDDIRIGGTLIGNTTINNASNEFNINYIDNIPGSQPAYKEGRVFYENTTNTLCYYDQFSGTTVNIGYENLIRVRNITGSSISNGQAVYITGAIGQTPTIALAQSNDPTISTKTIGIATHDIANNSFGKVCVFGLVNDINTGSYSDGDILYLSSSVPGGLTITPPASPNTVKRIGVVQYSHGVNGKILVNTGSSLSNDNALGTSQTIGVTQNAIKSYIDGGFMPLQGTPSLTGSLNIAAGSNNFSISGDNATFELPQDGLSPINIISNNGVNLADAAGAGLSYQSADGLGDAVSATIFPTSYTIEGPSSFPGVQYAANYGVNFTARSIPDVGFLDGRYTSSQGITKTGTNFTLGGTFSSNISLNSNTANTNSFTIGGTTRPNTIQFLAGDVIGNNSGAITINSTTTSISRTTTNPMSLVLSSSGMVVTDLAFTKGLTYAADYSTNFSADPRGIPDVGWVNSTKSPITFTANTYTSSQVGTTADVSKIIRMNVASANTYTINTGVYAVGTFLNIEQVGAGQTSIVAGGGVTITGTNGTLDLGSGLNVLHQYATDAWRLYNGSPFTLQNTTLTGLVTWTMGGNGLLLDGGDFAITGTGGYQLAFDNALGTLIDFPTNALGDTYYRSSVGYLGRLPIGTTGQVLTVSAGGLPSWATAVGVSDGDKGDITVSASGATWTVDNSAITYAKMQNAAGGTRIIGRSAVSSGALNEIVATAAGQVLRRDGSGLGFGAVDLADTDAVTGVLPTANGGSLSGTYTPTLTNVANLDGSTAYACQYMRVGDVVTVSGRFDVDITTISTLTQLDISLPIASALTAANQAGGTASTVSGVNDHAGIMADATNDRVSVVWQTSSGSAFSMFFSFTYLVQ